MKRLSEIPFGDIYIGMSVLSIVTNTKGKVTDINCNVDKEISILWEAAGAATCRARKPIRYYQYWLDNVVVSEDEKIYPTYS